ncbi:hypothetical protein I7I51_06697 [Histoplasma capsulatum]|uniref:Uncharacterized protein n=1 Tax=Ajellomyces capsulatus TaxID=5037 RepID=A0A8A1MH96_AJECA|nr:predicted protein [Histoplasma mississippiense (nom. inval.)]EDN06321.1 predicted protein [Histoplasma mississippiense (nom. inval.)]QSS65846.1 hypothetical protein I7I51_06697 [Histoplasma capsulatum]
MHDIICCSFPLDRVLAVTRRTGRKPIPPPDVLRQAWLSGKYNDEEENKVKSSSKMREPENHLLRGTDCRQNHGEDEENIANSQRNDFVIRSPSPSSGEIADAIPAKLKMSPMKLSSNEAGRLAGQFSLVQRAISC